MKVYVQRDTHGYAGSPVDMVFRFMNTLVAETADIECTSTAEINDGRPNCHVCSHGLSKLWSRKDVVAATGIFADTSHHSWLEFRVFEKKQTNPRRLAVLDVFPVNSAYPLMMSAGRLNPPQLDDSYVAVLDSLYQPPKGWQKDPTLNSAHFEEDVENMALAFGKTQVRLGLERPNW